MNQKNLKKFVYFILKKSQRLVSLNIIGQCLFHEGKYDESVKIFDKILEIDPESFSIKFTWRTYHEKREAIKAEKLLRALKINKLSFYVLNNIAGFYREELNYEKAINYYEQAPINPNNAYIYNNLSKIYFDLKP